MNVRDLDGEVAGMGPERAKDPRDMPDVDLDRIARPGFQLDDVPHLESHQIGHLDRRLGQDRLQRDRRYNRILCIDTFSCYLLIMV